MNIIIIIIGTRIITYTTAFLEYKKLKIPNAKYRIMFALDFRTEM